MRAVRERGLSADNPFEIEARTVGKDGLCRWFLYRYNPLRDEHGQITRWYVAGTDIEERKRAEERLQHENVALREEIDRASMFDSDRPLHSFQAVTQPLHFPFFPFALQNLYFSRKTRLGFIPFPRNQNTSQRREPSACEENVRKPLSQR